MINSSLHQNIIAAEGGWIVTEIFNTRRSAPNFYWPLIPGRELETPVYCRPNSIRPPFPSGV
jgi:hypothetical protein